ncbi:MAG: N-acetylmuramoyl-L-alanine amidase [Lachnospiraceae bacterium]|nr:N-acetylmuramoyl-L-alanine amidase [Lachnospiraceae bacterium]
MIMILTISMAVPAVGQAEEVLELYNYTSKKHISYTDKQIKVTLNGYEVDMKGTPGILVDGYSLVSYYDVFKTALGFTCTYDKAAGTVTIEHNSKKVVLTLGSKVALVDGKKVTMGTAPIKVKFKKANKTKILVPSRFVAEQFGLSYTWTSKTSTVAIVKPLELYYNGQEYSYTGASTQVYVDGSKVSLGKMPGIILENTTMLRAKKVFGDSMGVDYTYSSKTKTVVLSRGNLVLTMKLGKQEADLNGTAIWLEHAPLSVKNLENNTSYIIVPASSAAKALGFRYTWDNSGIRSVIETTETTGVTGTVVLLDQDGQPSKTAKITPDGSQVPSAAPSPTESPDEPEDDSLYEADDEGEKNVHPDEEVPAAPTPTVSPSPAPTSTPSPTAAPTVTPTTAPTKVPTPTPTSAPDREEDGYPSIQDALFTWNTDEASAYVIQNLRSEACTEIAGIETEYIGTLINVSKDYAMNSTYEKYTFSFSMPVGAVKTTLTEDGSIQIIADQSIASERTYSLGGSLVDTIETGYLQDGTGGVSTLASVKLHVTNTSYRIRLSDDRMSLTLIVTANYLEKLQGGTTSEGEYLLFEGMQAFDPIISETDAEITILLPYTVNGVGLKYYTASTTGFEMIHYINVSKPTENQTRIVIGKDADTTYSIRTEGNQMYLYLPGTSASENSVVSNVRITLPSNITASMISDEDLYLNNQFVIRISGNYSDILNSTYIQNHADKVKNISISYSGGFTEILFTTSEIQGYRYQLNNHTLELEVRDPDLIYDKIVVLDPGHGGKQPGAIHYGYQEKDLVYKMLYTLGHKYFDNSGIKAYYTRIDDSTVTLTDRANFAEKVHADFFISLHLNAADAASASGTSVYYSASNNSRNDMGLRSQDLATALVNNLSEALGLRNRGIPTAKFDVVHLNTVPAVLIELAFMTNANDIKLLTNAEKQEIAAKTIYETVVQIFEEYPTGR